MFSSRIYKKLPVPLQEYFIAVRSVIRKTVRENALLLSRLSNNIDHNQWLDKGGIQALQTEKLRIILRKAQSDIPYYRKLFHDIGFDWRDLNDCSQISQLPILTKQTVRENIRLFIPEYPQRLFGFSGQTSGTTGTPLRVYQNLQAVSYERAFQKRLARWAGFVPGRRKIWLRGDMIVSREQNSPPFWRFNTAENQLMMSSYHLSESSLPFYIEKIRDFSPDMISAYPSSIYTMAKYMKNHGMEPLKTGRIITSSETLLSEQKHTIEEMFGCRIYDWYGSFERVCMIATCEHGRYHIMEDYGYTEMIDTKGDYQQIISTGFNNLFMPLIRYETGDLVFAENTDSFRCSCGRCFRMVKEIAGRNDDYLQFPDGTTYQGLGFLFKGDISILEGQIYQYKDYSVEIRVVPDKDYSSEDETVILKHARKRLGMEIPVSVRCMQEIPRTKRGKLKSIVSEFNEK